MHEITSILFAWVTWKTIRAFRRSAWSSFERPLVAGASLGHCPHVIWEIQGRVSIFQLALGQVYPSRPRQQHCIVPGWMCLHWHGWDLLWISAILAETNGLNYRAWLCIWIHNMTMLLFEKRMTFSNFIRVSSRIAELGGRPKQQLVIPYAGYSNVSAVQLWILP